MEIQGAELLRRCADGGAAPWREFVDRYGRRLEMGVRRGLRRAGLVADDELVADVVQEVYCRLIEGGGARLRRCRAGCEAEVAAYLGRLAERVAIDQARAARAAKRGGDRVAGEDPAQLDRRPQAVDPGPSPEARLLALEERRLVLRLCRRALGGGREARRNLRVARLALLEGWTSREISTRLAGALRPGSVDSLVCRLRRRLLPAAAVVPRR